MLARSLAAAAPHKTLLAACTRTVASQRQQRLSISATAAAATRLPRRSLLRGALLSCPPAGLFLAAPATSATPRQLPLPLGPIAAAGMSSETAGVTQQGDTGAVVVYVTVPDQSVAEKLSAALVSAHLAACVNIVPGLTSVYWWDGKVNRDPELLLIIKTRTTLLPTLTEQVKRLHPYDEPEVVALPIAGGSASYLQWLHGSTADPRVDQLPEKLQ